MFRTLAALSLLVLTSTLAGCYAPERMPGTAASQQSDTPADDPTADECVGDCLVCAEFCTVQLVCSDDPPSAEDCAWNCLSWFEFATPACTDAYRDVAECIGALDCAGFDDPSTCVPEIEDYHAECDDEAAADVDEPLPLISR